MRSASHLAGRGLSLLLGPPRPCDVKGEFIMAALHALARRKLNAGVSPPGTHSNHQIYLSR